MSKYLKSNFKNVLCVALAFCMIFSLFVPLAKILASAEDTPAKMLYIKTADSDKRLYQRAVVEVGETYYFSFVLSSDISFIPICRTDDSRIAVDATITPVEQQKKGKCIFYTYSYTIPEKDNNGNAISKSVFFGIQIKSACEGYFFSASVYTVKTKIRLNYLKIPVLCLVCSTVGHGIGKFGLPHTLLLL